MSLGKCAIAVTASCLPVLGLAAGAQLKLPEFDHLQHRATESVNLSIGPAALGLAAGMLGHSDPGDADFAEMVRGLKGIYIRSYEFAADDAYPAEAVEAVRQQLSQPDWTRVAQVRSQHDGGKVDIFVCLEHDKLQGLAVIASDRRQFTILNLVGSFDLRHLARLAQQFGLPELR